MLNSNQPPSTHLVNVSTRPLCPAIPVPGRTVPLVPPALTLLAHSTNLLIRQLRAVKCHQLKLVKCFKPFQGERFLARRPVQCLTSPGAWPCAHRAGRAPPHLCSPRPGGAPLHQEKGAGKGKLHITPPATELHVVWTILHPHLPLYSTSTQVTFRLWCCCWKRRPQAAAPPLPPASPLETRAGEAPAAPPLLCLAASVW